MHFRLSLRQLFLAGPAMGMVLIAALTIAYLWYAEHQNKLTMRIAEHDIRLLDRHTDLFASLSRHHMALYALLYDAPSLDEAQIYDRGRLVLDGIVATTGGIRNLIRTEIGQSELKAFKSKRTEG